MYFFLFFSTLQVLSQDTLNNNLYRFVIKIDPLPPLINEYSIIAEYQFKNAKSIGIDIGYKYKFNHAATIAGFRSIVGAGPFFRLNASSYYKDYKKGRMFFRGVFMYRYLTYYDESYTETIFGPADEFRIESAVINVYSIKTLLGLQKIILNRIIVEANVGFGLRYMNLDITVSKEYSPGDDFVEPDYPYNEYLERFFPTLHVGVKLGMVLLK